MITQHTPGPWRDGQDGNCRVYGPDGQGEDSGLIAVVYKGRANARLIAAAPDLLDALFRTLNYIENTETELGILLGCGDAARAAIAKATGA